MYKDKIEHIKSMKKWYKKNREKILKQKKQYHIENREKISEYKKQWYEKNKEKVKQYRIENEKHKKEYNKQYFKTENGKSTHQRGKFKRQIKMRNIINTLTSKEWLNLLEEYNYRCAYCDVEFDIENMPHKDHIIPISKGGQNTKDNIVPSCQSCNSKKGNRLDYNLIVKGKV